MIYGTAWKKEETTRLVEEALLCGFKAVDTACQPKHYREDLVGLGFEQETANTILDKVSSEEEVDSSSPEANSEEQES